MDFKALVLFFALFAVAASGATVCKCAEEEKKEAPVEKYTLKVDDGKKQIEETVEIDTEKETETFDIPGDGDTSPNAPGDVKIVYDFKLKKTNSPTQATFRYTVVGTLNDRSILSDEMANMCAKYPIYLIKERSALSAELEKKEEIKRTKRDSCYVVCFQNCYAPNCCHWDCYIICV